MSCAADTTYHYQSYRLSYSLFSYKGLYIHQTAIKFALQLHKKAFLFLSSEVSLDELRFQEGDVIFSSDTVLNQERPFDFLKGLINSLDIFLMLRLWICGSGITNWNTEACPQMHYDRFWMSYSFLNIDKLIEFIKHTRMPKNIKINRSYEVLSGHNQRYSKEDSYCKSA